MAIFSADHIRQMSNEKPEAVCPVSTTERHIYIIPYDAWGRANPVANPRCEACHRLVRQDGARWVTYTDDPPPPAWVLAGPLTIREEDTIEDVL